jgi:hypothetical protein
MDMAAVMLCKPKNRKKEIPVFLRKSYRPSGGRKKEKEIPPSPVRRVSFSFFSEGVTPSKNRKTEDSWQPLGEVAARIVERLR